MFGDGGGGHELFMAYLGRTQKQHDVRNILLVDFFFFFGWDQVLK